jgi:pyridoxal phosphate enzyme, yggS family
MSETIATRLEKIVLTLPEGVKLVAVSKFHPADAIAQAHRCGQKIFGESRAAELESKASELPDDIEWHFIGHLQTNKVRQVLPHVALIHSVDSERLLRTIDTEAARLGITANVLLQVHVAAEETKYGFYPDEMLRVATLVAKELKHVKVCGVMGMATNTNDMERVERDFDEIRHCADHLQHIIPEAKEISMGMSHDYHLAIKYGSTMVRIGTDIFGNREY